MRGSAIQLKVLGDMAVAGGLRVEEVFETRSGGIAVDGLAEAAGGPAACDPHGVRFSGPNLQLKTAGRTESASGVAYGGADARNRELFALGKSTMPCNSSRYVRHSGIK